MKKLNLLIIMTLLFSFNVLGFCYVDGECGDNYSNVYPQNINDFNGLTNEKEVFIGNPSGNSFQENIIKKVNDENTITLNNLVDETNIEFKNDGDFYTELQKQNANANVSLFTQKDLNSLIRDKTSLLTLENVNWTFILLIIIMELFKIIVNLSIILISILLFFRTIPFVFKMIKNLMFKIVVKVNK